MIPKWMRKKQRQCFHHELLQRSESYTDGDFRHARSFVRSQLIETGKAKMFWCEEELGGCGKVWII